MIFMGSPQAANDNPVRVKSFGFTLLSYRGKVYKEIIN